MSLVTRMLARATDAPGGVGVRRRAARARRSLAICAGIAGASEPGRITVQTHGGRRAARPSSSATSPRLEGSATALADVELGPAPAAGAPRRLEGEAILRRLQEAGMDASATRYVIPATRAGRARRRKR